MIPAGLAVWFLMMCLEVYDLHPEHMIWYSFCTLVPIVRRLSYGRPSEDARGRGSVAR